MTLLLVWIVFVIIAPLLVDTNGTSVLNRVVACFSIHKNYLQLTKKDTNEFDFLYGLRFIFLVTSTYLHVFLFSFLWVPQAVLNILNFNASLLFKLTSTSWTNGMSYNFVWAAFVGFFSRINSDKKVLTTSEFILALLSRFLRTVPTVLGCYLLILAVPRSLGSGPLWNASLDKIRQNCRTGAWRELTYTQNIINPSDMCLMPSWIVAPDLHFFIASLFIITLYRYHAFLCKLLLTGGVFMGVLLQALYLLYTNSPGLIDFTKYDRALFNQYSGIHTNTVNYISSYMLGMLTAITCHEKMKTSHRVSVHFALVCTRLESSRRKSMSLPLSHTVRADHFVRCHWLYGSVYGDVAFVVGLAITGSTGRDHIRFYSQNCCRNFLLIIRVLVLQSSR